MRDLRTERCRKKINGAEKGKKLRKHEGKRDFADIP
jgi:hypothetical protein